MYSIEILQQEKERLIKEQAEPQVLEEIDQAIIALQLLYDPTPGSKIITKDRLEKIRDGIIDILGREIQDDNTLRRIVEGVYQL